MCLLFIHLFPCADQSSSSVAPAVKLGSCLSMDGRRHENGQSWHDGCRDCYCHAGREMCALISCPVPPCDNPTIRPGHCCPTCPGESTLQHTYNLRRYSKDAFYMLKYRLSLTQKSPVPISQSWARRPCVWPRVESTLWRARRGTLTPALSAPATAAVCSVRRRCARPCSATVQSERRIPAALTVQVRLYIWKRSSGLL